MSELMTLTTGHCICDQGWIYALCGEWRRTIGARPLRCDLEDRRNNKPKVEHGPTDIQHAILHPESLLLFDGEESISEGGEPGLSVCGARILLRQGQLSIV